MDCTDFVSEALSQTPAYTARVYSQLFPKARPVLAITLILTLILALLFALTNRVGEELTARPQTSCGVPFGVLPGRIWSSFH